MFISGCAGAGGDYYGDISTASHYEDTASIFGLLWNIGKYHAYSVPKADRAKHEQCVYFSLDTLFIGEKCDWYSENGATYGSVQVVAHRQQGAGTCTTLYNGVFHKGKWATWQDTACRDGDSQWTFVER